MRTLGRLFGHFPIDPIKLLRAKRSHLEYPFGLCVVIDETLCASRDPLIDNLDQFGRAALMDDLCGETRPRAMKEQFFADWKDKLAFVLTQAIAFEEKRRIVAGKKVRRSHRWDQSPLHVGNRDQN